MDANTVGAVAALTGVSVRTLHHYDHIGLVVPSVRTPAGYRGYTDADIERLHLVLVYRSVGMPLDEIRALLDDPSADVVEHLRRQHELLLDQADRLQRIIKAVEELMNAHRSGVQLTAEKQVEIFGTTAFGEEYAAEAEERWGGSDACKQSQQRVSKFSKQDWIAIWRRTTARRSSGSTRAATTCTAAWSRCIRPTTGSPGTTTTPSPGWPCSSTTSSWLASIGDRRTPSHR
jgi:DNA-binding transcriptional MerR regulator